MRCSFRLLAALSLGVLLLPAQQIQEGTVTIDSTQAKYFYGGAPGNESAPTVVVLPGGRSSPEEAQKLTAAWQAAVTPRGWRVITPLVYGGADTGVKALDLILLEALPKVHADQTAVYLAGAGPSATEVFYTLSRIPDHFAAAVAINGSPKTAIGSNRLYGANTQVAPLLWANPPADILMDKLRLTTAGYNVEIREKIGDAQIVDWLAAHHRDLYPPSIDCETGLPALARCYWIEMTKFDPRLRNDALESTRVAPGSGAYLDLGGFGYDPGDKGPGVGVVWLPENYKGPLHLHDRITMLAGKTVQSGTDYLTRMDEENEERPVAVMIERDGKRERIETRILLPTREELTTARVKAVYTPAQKEILVISRVVSEMRVTIPKGWDIANLSWNGTDLRPASAGCWVLSEDKEAPSIASCQ
jgi:hypothetical protein